MTERWCTLAGTIFLEDKSICSFIEVINKKERKGIITNIKIKQKRANRLCMLGLFSR